MIDGDTLLLTNGKRVRPIGVDTSGLHDFKQLYCGAKPIQRTMETIKALEKKVSAFAKSLVDWKEHKNKPPGQIGLDYLAGNIYVSVFTRFDSNLLFKYLRFCFFCHRVMPKLTSTEILTNR